MTPELLREALACENLQLGTYMPAGVHMRTLLQQHRMEEAGRLINQPFVVAIETPFSQIAEVVIEAKRRSASTSQGWLFAFRTHDRPPSYG
jgi:hypothetical protein